ncbi:MAG: hypothetical protein QOD74_917 [Variibacter sp.]|jgi:hypothetical protein|nr:hypothetical protein [Variibacter sp.]
MRTDAQTKLDAVGARAFALNLTQLVQELSTVLREETAVVHAGDLRAAAAFEGRKADLAGRYLASAVHLKTYARDFKRLAPEAMQMLETVIAAFEPAVRLNLAVLATAHAVAEGLVRGAAEEVAKQGAPTTYGRYGRPALPTTRKADPVALLRTL